MTILELAVKRLLETEDELDVANDLRLDEVWNLGEGRVSKVLLDEIQRIEILRRCRVAHLRKLMENIT